MKTVVHWIGATLLAILLLGSVPAREPGCDSSGTCHHRQPPTVYDVENTGARNPPPVFPTFGQLPIIRPLPDPFVGGRPLFRWQLLHPEHSAAAEPDLLDSGRREYLHP